MAFSAQRRLPHYEDRPHGRGYRTLEIGHVHHEFGDMAKWGSTRDAFEGLRHYGPERIVDALSAILNQLTGESFRSIHNGGTERERVADVNGWRIYASRLMEAHGQ